MSSQPSTSSVSDVTSNDEEIVILEDLSRHFTVIRDPQGIKCNYCNESWKNLTSTTKKAHLSNLKFASQYKIRLCSQMPANVSKIMMNKFQELEIKAGAKRNFIDRLNDEMNYEYQEIEAGRVKKKGTIEAGLNSAACTLADQKIAQYLYVTRQSFNSCESTAYQEMVSAISNAGPGYIGPSRQVVQDRLLDERFAIVKRADEERLSRHSERGEGMTITSDACTIHKKPLTNYIAKYQNEPGILLKYEDATELYQEDATKTADRVFDGLVEVIENVGPSNVTAVTLDNAPVMLAAMALLQIRYEFLFCLGCLAHKVNTLVKHLIKDDDMNDIFEIVEKTKKIVHHFNDKHKPHALLQLHLSEHLMTTLSFIIPADTRFGLYLLSLHRVYRMKAALQSCVISREHILFCENGSIEDDEVVEIIKDDIYWDTLLKLLTLLLPLLRLIRLAELNCENIGKFYPAMVAVKAHLEAEHTLLPYGWKIRDKFNSKAKLGEWLQCIHLAAYVLDPEYWDVDHMAMADAMDAFAQVIDKVFFHRSPPDQGWFSMLMGQLNTYKKKEGHFSRPCAVRAAQTVPPTTFFKTYGIATMELTYMAKKIFLVSIANEAAELNWKQYKDNCTKSRSALLPDKVHKLICIQAAATLRENHLNGFKYEAAKWTTDDEVCKLSKQVEMSRDNIIVRFLNYQEDWEEDKIRTKNRAHESLLNDKYQHVYLYDSDTQETRRIVHVEWSTAHRPAKYAVVTQFVHGIHENEEDDLVSYYINESLFDCIRAAPLPYNQQRKLIERPN
jgi:hypothetical protein